MKAKIDQEMQTVKRVYTIPLVTSIKVDHEISLVMMSESGEPPPEFLLKLPRTFIVK